MNNKLQIYLTKGINNNSNILIYAQSLFVLKITLAFWGVVIVTFFSYFLSGYIGVLFTVSLSVDIQKKLGKQYNTHG